MADRNRDVVRALGKERTIVCGSFAPNGAGAIVADPLWLGFAVTRTGVGAYLITLTDSWPALMAANFTIAMSAATDLKIQLGAVDVVTAKTIAFSALAVATPTEIAANAANRIYFELILRNTTVTP